MMSASLRKLPKYWKNIPILKGGRRRSYQTFSVAASSYSPPSSTSNSLLELKIYKCWRDNRVLHTAQPLSSEIKTVQVPPFAESVTEGDLRWVKAVGDQVKEDESVAEVETDKTTVPVNAPFSGIIIELLVEDGSTVAPGTPIFKIQSKDVGDLPSLEKSTVPVTATASAAVAAATVSAVTRQTVPTASHTPAIPPPLPQPAAEAPKGQLLQSIPVAAIKHSSFIHQAEVKMPPVDYTKEITGTRTEQRVKMSRMRLRIAQRLKDAQTSNAMLTTFNEIDMGNIMEMRKSIGDAFQKKHGIKLGFMSAFIKACAYSLQELPVVNAVIENQEIVYRDYVDISVAVATPKGLVVPVIRSAESMNYADIERSLVELGEKAKSGALAVEDMDGGTFTISNGGVFGSLFGTPIINPPQSAILGMHGIFDRPVARNGQVVIRPMMFVALTYDHRLIDGREAVTFLRKIKTTVEDPRAMLCGL